MHRAMVLDSWENRWTRDRFVGHTRARRLDRWRVRVEMLDNMWRRRGHRRWNHGNRLGFRELGFVRDWLDGRRFDRRLDRSRFDRSRFEKVLFDDDRLRLGRRGG